MPHTSGSDYVKSWAGLFKIGEFFCLLIAFSCLADFADKSENNGSFKFFLFVAITAWLITMILFVLFSSGAHDRISMNWTLAMLIYSAVYVFLLLISTSLVAEKARQFRRGVRKIYTKDSKGEKHYEFEDTCDYYSDSGSPCSNVEAATVFAFIALALFLADTVFYLMEYRSTTGPAADQGGFVQHDEAGTPKDYNRSDIEQIP